MSNDYWREPDYGVDGPPRNWRDETSEFELNQAANEAIRLADAERALREDRQLKLFEVDR